MGAGLAQLKATLLTALGELTVGQDLRQQSRIALISYAASAHIIADLTTYRDYISFATALYNNVTITDETDVNLIDALAKADIVRSGVSSSLTRQIVYIVAASAYNGKGKTDPWPYAKQIRESGAKILTYAYKRDNEGDAEVDKVGELASPGYVFRSDSGNAPQLGGAIQRMLCDANCFCPNDWVQLADDFQKPTKYFAECLLFSSTPANWFSAQMACTNMVNNNAFLASEFTEGKHQFHLAYAANTTKNGVVPPFFIGLSWDSATRRYVWSEKSDNNTQIPLDPSGYQPWSRGSGNHLYAGVDGVQVQKSGFLAYWNDVNTFRKVGQYICQVNACDTDNFCDDSIDGNQ